ncbi:MAG: hypothetical protein K8S16_16775 [Bacteroidales bacterium]|nr:hypothetical protein [Bacteroidales bacterium]
MNTKRISILVLFLIPLFVVSQSVSPEVVSSAGDYFEGANASLSWTLGEIATETYTSGNIILTQGFQQPTAITIHGIDLDVLVYLEGPFETGSMYTTLKNEGQIPLNQPYNVSPWGYTGTENVASIPDDVVDWVLVDLRDATGAAAALPGTSVEMQAAFILNNGSVVGIDGSSVLQFTATISNDPYVVVWHRNHLGVLSATSPVESGGIYTYNFSTSLAQAHGGGLGYKLIDTGVFGMAGGDANGDGVIDAADKALWSSNAGTNGYLSSDFNMDSEVNNPDKNDTWVENGSLSSQVPE